MPIYIAKNYKGQPESIILADNYELAAAYFLGKGIHEYTMSTITESDLDDQATGILPLLSTTEIEMNGELTLTVEE